MHVYNAVQCLHLIKITKYFAPCNLEELLFSLEQSRIIQ